MNRYDVFVNYDENDYPIICSRPSKTGMYANANEAAKRMAELEEEIIRLRETLCSVVTNSLSCEQCSASHIAGKALGDQE